MKVFVLLTLAVLLMVSADMALAGFGCPYYQYECNGHCQSIGCRAGYCDAFTFWLRCTCTGCSGKVTPTSEGPSVEERGTVTQPSSDWDVYAPGVVEKWTNMYTNNNNSELNIWNSNGCNLVMILRRNFLFSFLEVQIFQAEWTLTNS